MQAVPSFLLSNINRLITPSGHNKVGFLYDQAVNNNALFVWVTETWLHPGVLDAEFSHGFQGYSLHRSDRAGGRQGGGVALYLREDLTGDILATYAQTIPNRGGSVCEVLVVKLYTVVCVMYRPPDTRLEEFSVVLKSLDTTLTSLPTPAPTVVLMGDMNFPLTCITWRRSEEGLLVPIVAGHRENDHTGREDCCGRGMPKLVGSLNLATPSIS